MKGQVYIKMVGRKKDPEPLTKISVLIPFKWLEVKNEEGITWRALIKRGFNAKEKIFELNNELEDFIQRMSQLNAQNRDLRSRILKLEMKDNEENKMP